MPGARAGSVQIRPWLTLSSDAEGQPSGQCIDGSFKSNTRFGRISLWVCFLSNLVYPAVIAVT